MRSSIFLQVVGCALAATATGAFDCRPVLRSPEYKEDLRFDFSSLSTLQEATLKTETPPTTNEARFKLALCGDDTVPQDDGLAEEDQCPSNTKGCLTLLNHKSSSKEPSRITAVIPVWTLDTPDSYITLKPKPDYEGADLEISGGEYAGVQQKLKLSLSCALDPGEDGLQLISYSPGEVVLKWVTEAACPLASDGKGDDRNGDDGDREDDGPTPGERRSSGWGFFAFLKTIFWLGFFGVLAYFVIGIYYNFTTYGARGLDLLPHREFWEDFPRMVADLISHVFSGFRGRSGRTGSGGSGGGGSRGGYEALG